MYVCECVCMREGGCVLVLFVCAKEMEEGREGGREGVGDGEGKARGSVCVCIHV